MKQFLLTGLTAILMLGTSFTGRAVEPTPNYKEDFSTLYKGYTSTSMTRSGYPYPVHYWIREGVTSKSMAVNNTYDHTGAGTARSIGWSVSNQGSNSNQSEVLVTPKVGGDISFWVHRSISSTTSTLGSEVELFVMTVDETGTWTRTALKTALPNVTIEGLEDATGIVGNDMATWKQVKIKNVPDETRLGIRLNGLLIDDFEASQIWKEWPSYLWDGTIIPYIDVTKLGTTYTKYYLDKDNNFLDGDKPYELEVQLKQTVNAGTPTDDMFKYMFKLKFASIPGDDQYITLVGEDNQPIILQFDNKLENDWLSTTATVNYHDEKILKFGLKNLDPKYFNQNASLVAIRLDQDNQQVGSEISMQRKNTVAADGVWNALGWSNFQFEALIPIPVMTYSLSNLTESTLATSLTTSLSTVLPWFINPIGNEAPIYVGNKAGRAEAKITKIEFQDAEGNPSNDFGLVEAFPQGGITVGANKVVSVKPKLAATAPGFYTGKMLVTIEGSEEPFVALLEGAVKPEYETQYLFHNPSNGGSTSIPTGWLTTGSWAISSMSNFQHKVDGKWTYSMNSAAPTAGTTVLLVSPKLKFEENGEIWYDATCYQATGKLELLYSTDRSNWTVLKTMEVNSNPTVEKPYSSDNFNSFLTAQAGSYTENLWKTFKAEVPEGEGYIAFRTSSNNARVDNIITNAEEVEVDFDIAYISQEVPGKFSLNKIKDFTVRFRNLLEEIKADEYVLEIVQDGVVLKTVAGNQNLPKAQDVTFKLQCAFSTEGEHTLSVKLKKGDNVVSSEEVTVNVVDEGYDETFQVGASHTNNRLCEDYNSWPLTPNTGYAVTSEAIYPKSWLQDLNANGASADNNGINFDPNGPFTGLKEGDKITSISWIGYAGASVTGKTQVGIPVEVYLENTGDESFANNSETFKAEDAMTRVFKGIAYYDLTKTNSGTYTNATTPLVDTEEGFFKIIFDEPFEYEGNNLRVQLRLSQVVVDESKATDEIAFFDWTNNGTSIAGSLWALEARGTASNDNKYRLMYQSGNTGRTVNALLPMLIMGKEVPAAKLSGKVTHSVTEEGIEGVTVTASSPEGVAFSGVTDEDGKYEIEVGNPAFDFTVTASHNNFHSYSSANNEEEEDQTVNLAGGDVKHDFAMVERTVTITGVVKDGKGNAVAEATVTLTNPDDETYSAEVKTTDGGAFTITTNQLSSTLTITVSKDGYVTSTPQTVEIGEVEDGNTEETVTLENAIVIYEHVTISGTVKDGEGTPVEGASVTLTPVGAEDETDALTTTTEADGKFAITTGLIDTKFSIEVTMSGYVGYTNDDVVVGTENVALGDITIYEYVTISGVVKDAQGATVGNAKVMLFQGEIDQLVSEDDILPADTDQDGKFSFTLKTLDQLNTTYTLTVSKDGYIGYMNDKVDVKTSDVSVDDITIYKYVTVSGTVIDGKEAAVAGATVTLSNEDGDEVDTATTAADGKFSFTLNSLDQLEATYTLTVEKVGYVTYTNDKVDVEYADVALDNVVLYKKATISGVIKNADNELISGATVTLSTKDGEVDTVTTEDDGAFEFPENELDTDYTLTVKAQGYLDKTHPVSVVKDDVTGLEVKLDVDPAASVSGVVKDGYSVTPGYGKIEITADGVDVVVVDLAGHVIASYKQLNGKAVVDGLSAGVYVVNKTKVVVK